MSFNIVGKMNKNNRSSKWENNIKLNKNLKVDF